MASEPDKHEVVKVKKRKVNCEPHLCTFTHSHSRSLNNTERRESTRKNVVLATGVYLKILKP